VWQQILPAGAASIAHVVSSRRPLARLDSRRACQSAKTGPEADRLPLLEKATASALASRAKRLESHQPLHPPVAPSPSAPAVPAPIPRAPVGSTCGACSIACAPSPYPRCSASHGPHLRRPRNPRTRNRLKQARRLKEFSTINRMSPTRNLGGAETLRKSAARLDTWCQIGSPAMASARGIVRNTPKGGGLWPRPVARQEATQRHPGITTNHGQTHPPAMKNGQNRGRAGPRLNAATDHPMGPARQSYHEGQGPMLGWERVPAGVTIERLQSPGRRTEKKHRIQRCAR